MPHYARAMMTPPDSQTESGQGIPIRFTASTPGIKRDGLDVDQSKWKLDHFQNNPVVLWVHDYRGQRLPLGRAEVFVEGGNLIADVVFDPADTFAVEVERKYRSGFLHTVSVGWNDVEIDGGIRHELLDLSAVPVPGDPNALIQRELAGLRNLHSALASVLETPAEDNEDSPEPEIRPASRTETIADAPASLGVGGVVDEYDGFEETREIDYAEVARHLLPLILANIQSHPETPDDEDPATRAGAMLSKRNQSDLKQAVSLIQGVVDRAAKEDKPAEDGNRAIDPDQAADEDQSPPETLLKLHALFEDLPSQ